MLKPSNKIRKTCKLRSSENRKETVAYYSDNNSDQMLIRSNYEVCLINSSKYEENLAYSTYEFINDAKVLEIDKYYLTHYSWSLDDEIEMLLSKVPIGEIYLLSPRNEDEKTILKTIYKVVEGYRTKVVLYSEKDEIKIGDYRINLLYSTPIGQTSMNAFTVSNNLNVYTYISSGLFGNNLDESLKNAISVSNHLIFGEHGRKYSNKTYIEEYLPKLKCLIIHSENLFLTQENMKRFTSSGCKIYSHPKDIIYFK